MVTCLLGSASLCSSRISALQASALPAKPVAVACGLAPQMTALLYYTDLRMQGLMPRTQSNGVKTRNKAMSG